MLKKIYNMAPIEIEWSSMTDEYNLYCPRVDIAVGPFATNTQYIAEYNTMMDSSREFIEKLVNCHEENVRKYERNYISPRFEQLKTRNINARCFIVVEIENRVSRKHLMGGAVNAAALGRIGLAIAWSDDKLKAFVKLKRYLDFLGSVGKNTFDTTNLLILNQEQFEQILVDTTTPNISANTVCG